VLVAGPGGVGTGRWPLGAAAGTTSLIDDGETFVIAVCCAPPPKVTAVAKPTFAPLTVIVEPAAPSGGLNVGVPGGRMPVNVCALRAVPAAVVTPTLPLGAGEGTVNWI